MPDISSIILLAPPILLALTLHEYAHGWVADKLGDPTARHAGRLTLNPLAHLDPLGTLTLFLFRFGWGKPVPVNPYNFRNGRTGDVMVSLAGITVNLILAFLFSQVLRLAVAGNWITDANVSSPVSQLLLNTIIINLYLAVFNLIPIPPLDGSHVLSSILPGTLRREYQRVAQYGPLLIMGLVLLDLLFHKSVFGIVLTPVVGFLFSTFTGNI
jgi:Zn-dependent protease